VGEEAAGALFAMMDSRTNLSQVLRKNAEELYWFMATVFLSTPNISRTKIFGTNDRDFGGLAIPREMRLFRSPDIQLICHFVPMGCKYLFGRDKCRIVVCLDPPHLQPHRAKTGPKMGHTPAEDHTSALDIRSSCGSKKSVLILERF
jgi:hypothetical protein